MRATADGLRARGLDGLCDDRDERAGVKLNDADLLGIPLRVTVSRRTLRDESVEVKARAAGEARQVPLADAVAAIARAFGEHGAA